MAKKEEVNKIPEKEQPKVEDKSNDKIKVKKSKMKKLKTSDEPIKIDLNAPVKTEVESDVIKVDLTKNEETTEKTAQEKAKEIASKIEEPKQEETAVLEEITSEETTEENVEEKVEEANKVISEAVEKQEQTGETLPENIQKVVEFMEETGGDLEDYVNLNKDYTKMDQDELLKEYYKQTKPHLSEEEVGFMLEDRFSYDKENDEERIIKRKKLALKEQVANAKTHLEEQKSKYYSEIKSGSKLTSEQQEAVNFYSEHKKETAKTEEYNKNAKNVFLNRTNKFFGDQFKGFEYGVGEKKFRFNVKDASQIKETQSDINNFIGKFLDNNNLMKDEAGYHKALFTAMNPDVVANHFYEQGKADALKDSMAKSKNVDMKPRQTFGEVKDNSGMKFRVVEDDKSPVFKFKTKK
jgi:hypothetical protein